MCEKVKGCNSRIDRCMKRLVRIMNEEADFKTLASCCGHGRYPMTIVCDVDGTRRKEILSNTEIPRKRRFYRTDDDGFYYIPEVSAKRN